MVLLPADVVEVRLGVAGVVAALADDDCGGVVLRPRGEPGHQEGVQVAVDDAVIGEPLSDRQSIAAADRNRRFSTRQRRREGLNSNEQACSKIQDWLQQFPALYSARDTMTSAYRSYPKSGSGRESPGRTLSWCKYGTQSLTYSDLHVLF